MSDQNDLIEAGRAIRIRRQASGLSQEALAERAGVHRNYVGLLERGERNASLTTLIAVARALNVTLAQLFEGVEAAARTGEP
jgi:transcriptional regulator with XRE-family HTH domain